MTVTYSQIIIQIVLGVKNPLNLIPEENLPEVFDHITGIIRNKWQKTVIVGGAKDHIHILIRLKPGVPVSSLVRDIKSNSTNFINQQDWMKGKFAWQNGFGAFSYGNSQLEQVKTYIKTQAEHHKTMSFREEYIAFLQKFDVVYEEKGLPPSA
jgi:REP element-mobilizing transposase RayT